MSLNPVPPALVDCPEVWMGSKIRIESYSLDTEGELLASQIKNAFATVFTIDDWIGSERASTGFAKGINITGTDKSLVDRLVESLQSVGLQKISTDPLPPPSQSMLLLAESRMKTKDVAAVIVVGVKPLPP
jgi:hypothetical protein